MISFPHTKFLNASCFQAHMGKGMASNFNPEHPFFIYIVEEDCGFGNCKPLSQKSTKQTLISKALFSSKCSDINLK